MTSHFGCGREAALCYPLQNEIFKKPVSEPLHKVLRHIAKVVSNSLGAVITLVLNGYGDDAIKICRSMFEGAVITGYLRDHPEADAIIDAPASPLHSYDVEL